MGVATAVGKVEEVGREDDGRCSGEGCEDWDGGDDAREVSWSGWAAATGRERRGWG